jgi:hypothetical protein
VPTLGREQRWGGLCLCRAGRSSSRRCQSQAGAVASGQRQGRTGLEEQGGEQRRAVAAEWPGRWALGGGVGRTSSCWRQGRDWAVASGRHRGQAGLERQCREQRWAAAARWLGRRALGGESVV